MIGLILIIEARYSRYITVMFRKYAVFYVNFNSNNQLLILLLYLTLLRGVE